MCVCLYPFDCWFVDAVLGTRTSNVELRKVNESRNVLCVLLCKNNNVSGSLGAYFPLSQQLCMIIHSFISVR